MLICADARALPLAANSVHCVVTSPPYWGLRDYGSEDAIGSEPTPDRYVDSMLEVFAQIARVLRPDGTVWLNLGDSYAGTVPGLNPKNLVGMPWRVALALQSAGWYLRSDIIWSKPNPMPESVTDRPTRSHEYLFLLSKFDRYYYDAAAIAEPHAELLRHQSEKRRLQRMTRAIAPVAGRGQSSKGIDSGWVAATHTMQTNPNGRNKRSVWTVATAQYGGAHFATFPEALIEPCILAGCPVGGRVLDPFIGSGTTGAVAERLGRRWVGVDLTYQHLARARTAQRGLMWA